ncbi:ABC transporter substrate-binding protein [Brucella pseudogrignonensis]|uniref:Iron complex transport system substrate-binding protein n=1 Tax=Brucella pseudogrignonensis TaxID=419475 RepID=A0ABU1M8E4_9HYPH|nr:ABC transporter substrate-binding protein [Brucella pseudogrignonensis]MDR6432307.1 iron complex transport system substrate-binding protein [Brucella pseudogrignonensis]
MSMIGSRVGRYTALAVLATTVAFSGFAKADTVEKLGDTSRIVSVGGAVTEIVYALGAGDKLVARDQTSTYPEQARELVDVGYMRRLSPEGVLSVNPTGILMSEGSGPPETLEVLKKASVPIVMVPEAFTGEGVIAKIDAVGKALGLEDKAKELAADVSRDLEAAEKISANQNPRKRVLFIMSAQEGRIMASGTGTGANGIITLAGGVNAIDSYQGYKQLTDEAVEKAAPDLILTMNIGKDSVQKEDLLKNPALANSPAGRSGNIVQMDSLYLLGFGPRTGAASRELSEKLYGKQAAN